MIFSQIFRIIILAGILTGIFLTRNPAEASLAPYDGIGGDGGAPFRLECGESAFLVGVAGRSGAFIDQVAGLCVKIDPVSGNWVGGVYETTRVGGNGGSSFSQVCPVGQALVGIEGTTDRFSGTLVVASLKIECTALKIRTEFLPAVIKGIRRIGIYGDPDSTKNRAQQDLCYRPLNGTGRSQEQWVPVGIRLEGRAGVFLDHLHILCGELAHDPKGYRVEFQTSTKEAVPEGTPLRISWRAKGSAPELTPSLQYRWELFDWTHTRRGGLGPQPTTVQAPCSYAAPPCEGGWISSTSGSAVTFQSLPPARYQLRVTVSTTAQTYAQSVATQDFEIRANQLSAVTVNPSTIRSGGISMATITLEGPAPPGGKKVYFSSSNAQLIPVPEALTIPGGATSTNLQLKADPKMLGGQVTIQASLNKPLNMAVAKNPELKVFGRGTPEPENFPVTKSLENAEEVRHSLENRESTDSVSSDGTPTVEISGSDASAMPEDIAQEQEITERGISSFGAVRRSQLPSGVLATTPKQGALKSFPDVVKTPAPPPGVPVPYPNNAGSTLQPESKLDETVKRHSSLITLPNESKQAVITVQSSMFESKPLIVPNMPSLRK